MSRRRWPTVALLVAILSACSAQEPAASASQSAPASREPDPSGSASEHPPASASAEPSTVTIPDEWTQVLSFGDESAQTVGGPIAYGSAGFLTLGTRWRAGLEGIPGLAGYALWRSSDGMLWEELEAPGTPAEMFWNALSSTSDGRYVLYGTQPGSTPGEYHSVALRSSDGVTWEGFESGLPELIYVQAIELGPNGYLLVGGQSSETNPTLWLSDDGLRWEQVHEFEQTTHYIQIHDADGGDEGYVVLGRRIEADSTAYQRFAFASADGREWFTREAPFGPDNQNFVFEAGVTSRGPDWVATLGHPGDVTAVWTSADGLAWVEVGSLNAPGSTSSPLLEEVGDALLFSPGSGAPFDGTVGAWSSTDAATWSILDLGADPWLRSLARGDGVVAVSGTIPAADFSSVGAVWVRASE